MSNNSPRFIKKMFLATANMLIPMQTAVLLYYFLSRWLGAENGPLIQGIGYVLPWLFMPLILLLPLALWRRSKLLVSMTAVSLLLFAGGYGRLFVPQLPVQTSAPTFTVMTYNVLYVNRNLDDTLANITQYQPDVLALHEYIPTLSAELHPKLAKVYPYHMVEQGRGFYSRYPIVSYEAVPMPYSFGGVGQKTLLDIEGQLVTLFSVHPGAPPARVAKVPGLPLHLPFGVADASQHQESMQTILAEVDDSSGPLALVGDLNMTDQHPAYAKLTDNLQDAFVERGSGMGFTFTPFGNYPLPVWRIDYVLYSPELTAVDIAIGDFAGSDHKPLIATLALPDVQETAMDN